MDARDFLSVSPPRAPSSSCDDSSTTQGVLDELFPVVIRKDVHVPDRNVRAEGDMRGGDESSSSSDEEVEKAVDTLRRVKNTTSEVCGVDDFGEVEVFQSTKKTLEKNVVAETKNDDFGIAYRSFSPAPKESTSSENLPRKPAFEDEREFERDALKSDETRAAVVSGLANGDEDSDDEFEYSVGGAPATDHDVLDITTRIDETSLSKKTRFEMKSALRSLQTRYRSPKIDDARDVEPDAEGEEGRDDGMTTLREEEDEDEDSDVSSEDDDDTLEKSDSKSESNAFSSFVPAHLDAYELRMPATRTTHGMSTKTKKTSTQSSLASASSSSSSPPPPSPHITFASALNHFQQNVNLERYRSEICVEDFSGCSGVERLKWNVRGGRPSISFDSGDGTLNGAALRDQIFLIARVPLLSGTSTDAMPPMHARILRTLYRKITGVSATKEVPLSGRHWETIGFQSGDPGRDLRDAGMLSLLQMLHLVETKPEFITRMWLQSQDSTRGFPLMATSIHFTLQVMRALRHGRLSKVCNQEKQVWTIVNRLHAGTMLAFSKDWHTNRRTIMEFSSTSDKIQQKMTSEAGCIALMRSWESNSTDRGADNGEYPVASPFTDLSSVSGAKRAEDFYNGSDG